MLLKRAGLVSTLQKPGPYTVFAPTDAAFKKVPKATLNALLQDKAKLKAVLLYHVLAGKLTATKVVKLRSAKTLNGASVQFRVAGSKVFVNTARVTKTDIMASNGVIHVINRVLIPAGRRPDGAALEPPPHRAGAHKAPSAAKRRPTEGR